MDGIIKNYRRGRNLQHLNQFLVAVEGIDSRAKASSLVGKKIVWKNKKAQSIGNIIGAHGDNGIVKAVFPKGLPGQALGTKIEIFE